MCTRNQAHHQLGLTHKIVGGGVNDGSRSLLNLARREWHPALELTFSGLLSVDPSAPLPNSCRSSRIKGSGTQPWSSPSPATSQLICLPRRQIHIGAVGSAACLPCHRDEDDERSTCSSAALELVTHRPPLTDPSFFS